MKGLVTEVCVGLGKLTAKFNAMSRLGRDRGKNSFVGAGLEIQGAAQKELW